MKMSWIFYALIAMVCFSIFVLIIKKLTLLGMNSKLINLYIFGLVFAGFLVWNLSTKSELKITKAMLIFLLIASVLSLIGNFLNFYLVKIAPNPGYVPAIIGLQGVLASILAFFIFKSELTILKISGLILAAIAIILISI